MPACPMVQVIKVRYAPLARSTSSTERAGGREGPYSERAYTYGPPMEMKVVVILSPFASLRVDCAKDLQFPSEAN